jgi:tetratricopeptide (TPR) repeat protein
MPESSTIFQKPVGSLLRLWLMRLSAMLLIPAFFLVGIEGCLRITGYGYSTRFFVPSNVDGVDYLVPNERFTHRFFPASIARPIQPFRMPVDKPKGTYRIFLFGASAALGDPDASYGMGPQLEVLLEDRFPGTDFEVICTAMTAINSNVVLPIARECSKLDGDLWIVYLGNNEMVGPFGAGTVFGKKAPSVSFIRASLFIKSTRMGQLMTEILGGANTETETPSRWTGIDMFKENQIRQGDVGRAKVYDNFRKNLESIVLAARDAKVPVLLSTVGSNLKDCSPFGSLNQLGLNSEDRDLCNKAFSRAESLVESGDFEEALKSYSEAELLNSSFAEIPYRKGLALLSIAREKEAYEAFRKARDLDSLVVRADSRINEIIIEVASEREEGVLLVDAENFMQREVVPGSDWFYEHVHFTPEGNFRIAKLFAENLEPILPRNITRSGKSDWMDMRACLDERALTVWDRLRIFQEIYHRISGSPFDGQSSNSANKAFIANEMKKTKSFLGESTQSLDLRLYENAIERRPTNAALLGNFAQFLDGNQFDERALEYAYRLRDLFPDIAWTHYYLGALLASNGHLNKAEASLEKALEILDEFSHAEKALKAIERQRFRKLLNPSNP